MSFQIYIRLWVNFTNIFLYVFRFVITHPEVKFWIKYARFEENHGFIHSARQIYERSVQFFGDDHLDEKLFIAFAKFEENQKEHDRARVIYKYALEHIPKDQTKELYKSYTIHEKKYGDRSGIEEAIVSKRKLQYEQEIQENPNNYDAWFDYIRLIEGKQCCFFFYQFNTVVFNLVSISIIIADYYKTNIKMKTTSVYPKGKNYKKVLIMLKKIHILLFLKSTLVTILKCGNTDFFFI